MSLVFDNARLPDPGQQDVLTAPRKTPMAGHRKATERWCETCQRWHKTERAMGGPEPCPFEGVRPIAPAGPAVIHADPNTRNPWNPNYTGPR